MKRIQRDSPTGLCITHRLAIHIHNAELCRPMIIESVAAHPFFFSSSYRDWMMMELQSLARAPCRLSLNRKRPLGGCVMIAERNFYRRIGPRDDVLFQHFHHPIFTKKKSFFLLLFRCSLNPPLSDLINHQIVSTGISLLSLYNLIIDWN